MVQLVNAETFESDGLLDNVLSTYGPDAILSETPIPSPCVSLRDMTARLMDRLGTAYVCGGSFDYSCISLTSDSVTIQSLKHVLNIMCQVYELALLVVFIGRTYVPTPATAIMKPASLRKEVSFLLEQVDQRRKQLSDTLATPETYEMLLPSILDTEHLSAWVEAVSFVNKETKAKLFAKVVAVTMELAETTKQKTPASGHLVNDRTWIKAKCKRELLDGFDRVVFSALCGDLHKALFSASKTYDTLKIGTQPLEEVFEGIREAQEVCNEAKKQIVLIAHLHVCLAVTGDAQLDEANRLHAKQADVPTPVREAIGGLKAKYDAAKAAEESKSVAAKRRRLG